MGEHTCQRWHRDHYCGRAIITYNLCGTEYTSEVGEVFAGFTGVFFVGTFGLEGCWFRWWRIFYGFDQGKSHGENHHHLGNMVFACSKHLTCKSQVLVRILGVFGKSKPQKCPPKFRREDSGIMVVVFPPPRTKRGVEKRPSPNHLFIQRLRLWLLVSWRVRPYIIKGSWWFIIPEGAFLRAALVA